jgi:hypothetical protein
MYDIAEDETLTEIHRYFLQRKDGQFYIEIMEELRGPAHAKFLAVPSLTTARSEPEYWKSGDTEADALTACLECIKGVPTKTLFPGRIFQPPPVMAFD